MPRPTMLSNPAAMAFMVGLTDKEQKHLLRYLSGPHIGHGGVRLSREHLAVAVEAKVRELEGQAAAMRDWLGRHRIEQRRRGRSDS